MNIQSKSSCHSCRSDRKLSLCTGCRCVSYCSPACQRMDWSHHKPFCKAVGKNSRFRENDVKTVEPLSKIAISSYLIWLEDQCVNIQDVQISKQTKKKKFSSFGSQYRQLSLHLSRHMRGIASSVLRESMLNTIFGGNFPVNNSFKVCQYKKNDLEVVILGGTPYYQSESNPNSAFEEEVIADESDIKKMYDVIEGMLCVIVNDEMKEVDIGRTYIFDVTTGKNVKTNCLDDERYRIKNITLGRHNILMKLCVAVESKEHLRAPNLQKINVGTLESTHNEDPIYNYEKFKNTGGEQYIRDMSVIELLFPKEQQRRFTQLTDIVLGNSIQNLMPMQGDNSYAISIFRGIGNCCPVLRVLDMTGSVLQSDSLIYLILRDPVEALHKYTYNSTDFWMKKGFHNPKGKIGPHDITSYCQYCKDPWAGESGHRCGWFICQLKIVFNVVNDEIYRIIRDNSWKYILDDENRAKFKELIKEEMEKREKLGEDSDESIQLEVDSDNDNDSIQIEKHDVENCSDNDVHDSLCSSDKNDTGDVLNKEHIKQMKEAVEKKIDMRDDSDSSSPLEVDSDNDSILKKKHEENCDIDDSLSSSDDNDSGDNSFGKGNKEIDSLRPLKHVISATDMVRSLTDPLYELVRSPRSIPLTSPDGVKPVKDVNAIWFPPSDVLYKPIEGNNWIKDGQDYSMICNPLTKTLEVLYVSSTGAEKFSSEAVYPFITKACPNIKKLGDSLTVLKGLRLFESMEIMSGFTTGLQEFYLHYPNMLKYTGDTQPTLMQYLVPIPQFTTPEESCMGEFKPYIPPTMMNNNFCKKDKDMGFVNQEGKGLERIYNEKAPLIKAADVDEVVKMIAKDCDMVGSLCPQLRKLSVYMDHPWSIGLMQFRVQNMYSGLSRLSMLTQLVVSAHRWENVSGIITAVGSKLTHIHIVISKRNDAEQGELDHISRECPLLTNLYLGIGTSPLEIKDIENFPGFPNLTRAYIGEAFKWSSFLHLLSTSPLLTTLSIDKINEHWAGKPPNVEITVDMVAHLEKAISGCSQIKNLSFSWLDVESSLVVVRLVSAFPKLQSIGRLALQPKQFSLLDGYVSMMAEDGVKIKAFNKEGIEQLGQLPQAYHDAEENCTIS